MPIPATKYIWFNGKLVPWEKATVHVLSHALHYGSSVFEGVRAYETPRGPAIFRLRDHTRRLFDSAKIYRINIPFNEDQINHALPRSHRAERPGARRVPAPGGVPRLRRGRRGAEDRPARRSGDRRLGMGHVSRRRGRRRRRRVRVVVAARRAEHDSRAWRRPAATTCRASSSASRPSASASSKASACRTDGTVSEGAGENLFVDQGWRAVHARRGAFAAQRHHAPHRDDAGEGDGHRSARDRRSRARCCTSPTNCSSPARPPKSRRSARSMPSRSATASAVRSPRSCRRPTSLSCRARPQDKGGWLDYVDMNRAASGCGSV